MSKKHERSFCEAISVSVPPTSTCTNFTSLSCSTSEGRIVLNVSPVENLNWGMLHICNFSLVKVSLLLLSCKSTGKLFSGFVLTNSDVVAETQMRSLGSKTIVFGRRLNSLFHFWSKLKFSYDDNFLIWWAWLLHFAMCLEDANTALGCHACGQASNLV